MARKFKVGEWCKIDITKVPDHYVLGDTDNLYRKVISYSVNALYPYRVAYNLQSIPNIYEAKELLKLTKLEKELYT